ncbi:MAG: beta-eliminating lyase-related protein [Pseudomonadota bacterium]
MKRYQDLIARCDVRLTGHPRLTMSEQLAEIDRWAGRFDAQDVYGRGELIESFEAEVAGMLGKPAALFLPSGTMAQCIALRVWSDRAGNRSVGFHPTSHLELHEQHAYRELYGLDGVLLGEPDRPIALEDLDAAARPLAAVLLELPMREIGGQLPSWDALVAQSAWARGNGVALHMDGARLWQCTSHFERDLATIAGLFDSVYVSFYKDIGGIAGAMLAGAEDFIEDARTWLRRTGGNLYALFPYVLAARAGIERNLVGISDDVQAASWLVEELRKLGLTTTPARPPTNLFHLTLAVERESLLEYAIAWTEAHEVFLMPFPQRGTAERPVLEFSMGSAFRQHSPASWQHWIQDFYGNLPGAT